MKTRKLLSVLIALAMVLSLLPMTIFVSAAEIDNKYIVRGWDGTNVTESLLDIPTATTVTSETAEWSSGFYAVSGNVTLGSIMISTAYDEARDIEMPTDVKLILMDGCNLTVTGNIDVLMDCSLTVYAQKGETGTLTAQKGIGSGSRISCGDITIHGGNVTTTGTSARPAIGCGNQASMGVFTLYGGVVSATGAGTAPAIGHYGTTSSGTVNLYGGKLTAKAAEDTQAIKADTVTVGEKVNVKDGDGKTVTLPDGKTWAETLTGSFYTLYTQPVVEYRYYDKTKEFKIGECDDYTVVTKYTTEWTGGWYVVNDDVTIDGDVEISGNVNLILCDGKTLTVDGAIKGDSTFSVYAQSDGKEMGSLNVTGRFIITDLSNSGGILINGSVTINGGKVAAAGNKGIYSKDAVTINGGEVSATGTQYSIVSDGSITINGGDVTAQGGEKAVKYGNISIDESMTVYNQSNERVPRPVEQMWENLLTGTYYRIVHKDSAAPYRYYDEASKTLKMGLCCDYISVNNYTTVLADGKWYYADNSYENSLFMPILTGDVHLIIADDATLTWEGLSGSGHLYLHSQSTGSNAGQLICKGSNGYCGLAVTALTVDGVSVTATGSNGNKGNGSSPSGGCGVDGISATTITVNGGTVSATGGTGGEGNNGAQYNSGSGGAGGSGISVTMLTVNGGSVIATGGNGGYGGYGGTGGYGGAGGKGISATALTVNGGSVTTTGANGGWGGDSRGYDDGSTYGGDGGTGGIGISTVDLTVNDGIITTTGGTGGKGGKSANGDGADGANGASAEFGESVTAVEATVKANEADEFIPLPSGKSVSEYRFAKITKTFVLDSLLLNITGKDFTVTPSGGDAGTGTVIVALYDSEYLTRLLDLKCFNLANGEVPQGAFNQSGFVKAMWWASLSDKMPLCDAVGEDFKTKN